MTRLAAAAAALALLAGCGAPDELSREDAVKLANAREGVEDALDVSETLRTSRSEARRILAEVRRIISDGSLEAEPLDEFGLASLGELQQVVPNLVETDIDGVPEDLDRPALRRFLRFAAADPAPGAARAGGGEGGRDRRDPGGLRRGRGHARAPARSRGGERRDGQ